MHQTLHTRSRLTLGFVLSLSWTLASCGGGDAPADIAPENASTPAAESNAPASAGMSPTGTPTLRLIASGESGTFAGAPSCMTSLLVENLSDKPLVVFSAPFLPTDSESGAELERVGVQDVGARDLPLAPGATTSQPWKINVTGATCERVMYAMGDAMCALDGAPCGPIAVEQTGLAGMMPVTQKAR
jgi:hypothetical protein